MDFSKAPKAGKLTASKSALFTRVLTDQKLMDELTMETNESIYFDHSAKKTRGRRQLARNEFEAFVKANYDATSVIEIWSAEHFVERSRLYFTVILDIIRRQRGEMPKIGVLLQRQDSLYWWALRLIPTFIWIFTSWHTFTSDHIHYLATRHSLKVTRMEKNNLTDTELELFWQYTKSQRDANLQQHYLAYILTYITSIRPGSISLSDGGEKDIARGIMRDETLRWSDVDFFNTPDGRGIGVRIFFRYVKGYRYQHTNKTFVPTRTFTLLPTRSNRYHLDAAFIIIGVAFQRGLFGTEFPTIASLHQPRTARFYLPKVPEINAQPVLLRSSRGNTLLATEAMKAQSLNDRLQLTCTNLGLYQRFTMYSWRRTAIVETRRAEGIEAARDLAGHCSGSNAIYAYDEIGLSDKDVNAARLGEAQVPRDVLRKMFHQALSTLPPISATTGISAAVKQQEEMILWAKSKCAANAIYKSEEKEYHLLLQRINAKLFLGGITQYNAKAAVETSTRIGSPEKEELLEELKEIQDRFKATKRRLTEKYKDEFKAQKIIEAQQDLTTDDVYKRINGRAGSVNHNIDNVTEANNESWSGDLGSMGDDETSSSDEEELYTEEEDEGDSREAPAAWKDLPQEVTIEAEELFSDAEKTSLDQRIEALQMFVKEGQSTAILSKIQPEKPIATATSVSNQLHCHLCALDDSTPPDRRTKKWTKTTLDKHLASDYHSKLSILKRDAQSQLESKDSSGLLCYICIAEDEDQSVSETDDARYMFKTTQQYIKHLTTVHKYGLKDTEE